MGEIMSTSKRGLLHLIEVREIRVAFPGNRWECVDAAVVGDWACHPRPGAGDGWTVTHVPTGYSIDDLVSELRWDDALRVSSRLGRVLQMGKAKTVAQQRAIRHLVEAIVAEAMA